MSLCYLQEYGLVQETFVFVYFIVLDLRNSMIPSQFHPEVKFKYSC